MEDVNVPASYADLPPDPDDRVAAAAALFRHHVETLARKVADEGRKAVMDGEPPGGSSVARHEEELYRRLGRLSDEDRQAALYLRDAGVSSVVSRIMLLLTEMPNLFEGGIFPSFGESHRFRYKLILTLDDGSGNPEEIELNRNMRVFLNNPGVDMYLDMH